MSLFFSIPFLLSRRWEQYYFERCKNLLRSGRKDIYQNYDQSGFTKTRSTIATRVLHFFTPDQLSRSDLFKPIQQTNNHYWRWIDGWSVPTVNLMGTWVKKTTGKRTQMPRGSFLPSVIPYSPVHSRYLWPVLCCKSTLFCYDGK